MPIESNPQSIADLDASWPVGGDNTVDGNNHIQNLKHVLKTMFPDGTSGIGFSEPVLSTVTELNHLQGSTSNIQSQIDALNGGASAGKLFLAAPNGTKLISGSPTPPAGWKLTDIFTSSMLVASPPSLVGTTQGNQSPLEWSHSHAVQPFTLTTGQVPPHSHPMKYTVDETRGVYSYVDGREQRIPEQAGTTYAGDTERNSAAEAITQAVTASATWRPVIYHVTQIERDSSLDP